MAEDMDVDLRSMLDVQREIDGVQRKIDGVESQISIAKDPEEKKYLQEKEMQLREQGKQLRDEKMQLRALQLEKEKQRTLGKVPPATALQAAPDFYENILANIPPEIKAVVEDYKSHAIGLTKNDAGVTMFKGAPSLLFHYQDVATERLAEEAMKPGRTVIVTGPSGCGKTKLLYSFFSTRPGFYLSVIGGSYDVVSLVTHAESHLRRGLYQRNRLIVRLLVLLLLASRMAIYKLCKCLSHKEWLVFQAACRGLCKGQQLMDFGTYDVFEHLFSALARQIPRDISEEDLLKSTDGLMEFVQGCPDVAVDEAQILLTKFDSGYFLSGSVASKERPISNTFFETIKDALGHNAGSRQASLLVCGTGYSLHLHPDLVSSSGRWTKPDFEPVNHYLLFGMWERAEEMVKFAQDVLPNLSHEDRKLIEEWVFYRFRGRFRPFVSVVEQVLRGRSLADAAYFVDRFVTTKSRPSIETHGLQGSIYDTIAAISGRPATVKGVPLLHLIERAAIQFHCSGRGITLSRNLEVAVDVLEYGLGMVTSSAFSKPVVELSEPFVLRTAKNFFLETRGPGFLSEGVLQDLGNDPYTSSQGFKYQSFIPLIFELMWDRYGGRIADMPIFKPALKELPADPKYSIMSGLVATIQPGIARVMVHSPGYQTREFLMEKPMKRCSTLICEERLHGGADTITKLDVRFPEECEMTVLRQCFLLAEPRMSPRQFRAAVNKSNIIDRGLSGARGMVLIRMVDIFPALRPAGCDWFWWELDRNLIVLVVVVDAETGKDFFGPDAEVIIAMKKNAPVLDMLEE